MPWSGEALIPFYGVKAMVDNWKHNFSDGYDFGDIVSGEIGFKRDLKSPASPISSVPSSARAQEFANMSEREFADYEMREAHKLGVEADSSKYQRAYQDLIKAGLNPRLAIEALQGSGVSASSGYSYSESNSKSQSKSESSSNSFSSSAVIAALLVLAGKVIAALA